MGWVSLPSDIYVDELSHHGVKNQKWGRRRWQNPDGSYTQAGRIHYGIGIRKRLAKRAQEREEDKARTEALKTIAYSAKQQRAEAQLSAHKAQIEAEKAKKELRDAKRENSRFADITRKIHENHAAKRDKAESNKKEQETSRKVDAYVAAVQSGDKKQIKKVAKSLNNDEYRKAIDRVNMKYELDRAAADAKIAKGKQTVDRLRNSANVMSTGVDIWNAGAGIVSAFSGKNIPKINTKYEDPIDKLKKQLEYQTKQEALDTAKAGADKARYLAKQEKVKAATALKEYYKAYPEDESKPKEPSKKEDPYGWYKPETTYRNQSMDADKGWSSLGTMKTKDSYDLNTFSKVTPKAEASNKKKLFKSKDKPSSEPKWHADWRKESEKSEALSRAKQTYSYEPERKVTMNTSAADATAALNALTKASNRTKGKAFAFRKEDFATPMSTIKVDKKAKDMLQTMVVNSNKFYNLNDYKSKIDNPQYYNKHALRNNMLMVKGSRAFDLDELPKEQQKSFFAMLNASGYKF